MNKTNVRVGRQYIYKGHRYEVKHIGMIKMRNTGLSDWVKGVVYERVGEQPQDLPAGTVFSRELQDFADKFVPSELEVGDKVELFSMGKSRGCMEVVAVCDTTDEYCVHFKDRKERAKSHIDTGTRQVEVDEPEQATEYYYAKSHESVDSSIQKIIGKINNYIEILNGKTDGDVSDVINKVEEIKKVLNL